MLEVGKTYTANNGKEIFIESYEKWRGQFHGFPKGEPKEWPISYNYDGTPTNPTLRGDWDIWMCPHCGSTAGTWFDRSMSYDSEGNELEGMATRCNDCGKDVDAPPTIEEAPNDDVNSPHHYTVGGYEALDVIKAKLTPEEYRGFLKGNTLKYLMRANYKSQHDKDCKKAAFYSEKLKELVSD